MSKPCYDNKSADEIKELSYIVIINLLFLNKVPISPNSTDSQLNINPTIYYPARKQRKSADRRDLFVSKSKAITT